MYFSRAKSLMIVLFIFVNIFLIHIIYNDSKEKSISDSSISNTVSILKENNIFIDEKIIDKTTNNMFYLNLENPMSDESQLKSKIKGKITFNNGYYTFIPQNKLYDFKNLLPSSQTANDILKFLSKQGISSKYFVWDGTLDMGDGVYRATFLQNYESGRLYSSNLNVFFKKNGVIRVEGIYFDVDSVSSLENGIISPLEVLIRLTEYNFREKTVINSIDRGYYTESIYSSYSTLTAIPCYKITLSNGNEFYFDATNANFIELTKF